MKTRLGGRGGAGNPGKGDHDEEKYETPRRTRIPALETPAGAAAHHFLKMGTGFCRAFFPVFLAAFFVAKIKLVSTIGVYFSDFRMPLESQTENTHFGLAHLENVT